MHGTAATEAPAFASQAPTLRRYASTATQGAAVGPRDIYAVSNFRLVRHDKATG
ncbi:MAG: hypothetical protein U1E24_18680, partial [Phenylobacterium sp.]|nr:hypothetical protein [Phenylobacterium sp.]